MSIKQKIEKWIGETLGVEGGFGVEHPADLNHGDYSTNVAMVLAKKEKKNPDLLAEEFGKKLDQNKIDEIGKVTVVGGFINFFLTPKFFEDVTNDILTQGENYGHSSSRKGRKIIIEYTNTNVLKPLHIGHLMGNVIGQAISNILEANGAEVKRNTYQGDVGLHIAKAVWGIQKLGGIKEGLVFEVSNYIGEAYALGAAAYEENQEAQNKIKEINKKIFEKSDADINAIYEWGRGVSLAHFEELYKKLNTQFDYYFFESEVAKEALTIVRKFLEQGVFEESEGAIVFKGERFDPKLHTRVFVSSQGLPMYEAKDLAHALRKEEVYKADESIILTANEQDSYFQVVLKALEKIDPEIAQKTKHLSHGMLKLADGKMSSRKGNVVTGESLINDTENLIRQKISDRNFQEDLKNEIAETVAIAAIKYTILRQAVGGDIIFDFAKSISFEGDSGPYLQYTYVRALSILARVSDLKLDGEVKRPYDFEVIELEKILYRYREVVEKSGAEIAPHELLNYLTLLASSFNNFYGKEKILSEDANQSYKLYLTQAVATVLKNGLLLLGIRVPTRM